MVTVREITCERSCARILLDTGETFYLQREDLAVSGITEGETCDQEDFLRKIRILQYPRALNVAVAMLARRPCSSGEILSRLAYRRFTDEVAGLVLYKLEKEKLIDDRAFCGQWIRFRSGRGIGPSAIRRELRMKGIPDDMISAALEQLDPSEETENALKAARKAWSRIKPGGDVRRTRQKVTASLVRKGYGWEEARSACEAAEEEKA